MGPRDKWNAKITSYLESLYIKKGLSNLSVKSFPLKEQRNSWGCMHVWMWELNYRESWVLKNWCFWTVVLEKALESRLDCKEILPVHPKGNQFWVFIGKTGIEAETPILWPPDGKSWLIWNNPEAGKDWRQEEKGTTEDKMVAWHHWLDGRESGWIPGVGGGQGGLACCSPWGHKELDTTERLNWTEVVLGPGLLQG